MEIKTKKSTYYIQAAICVALILIDQITKIIVRNNLVNPDGSGKTFPLIKGVFVFHYLENRGSIWGIMQGRINFLLIVSVLLAAFLIYIYIKLPKLKFYEPLMWVVMIMMAGAIGNSIDRIVFGYVTDFLYFELINFPIFNFADICITLSAVFTFILVFTKYKEEEFAFFKPGKKKDGESSTDN